MSTLAFHETTHNLLLQRHLRNLLFLSKSGVITLAPNAMSATECASMSSSCQYQIKICLQLSSSQRKSSIHSCVCAGEPCTSHASCNNYALAREGQFEFLANSFVLNIHSAASNPISHRSLSTTCHESPVPTVPFVLSITCGRGAQSKLRSNSCVGGTACAVTKQCFECRDLSVMGVDVILKILQSLFEA